MKKFSRDAIYNHVFNALINFPTIYNSAIIYIKSFLLTTSVNLIRIKWMINSRASISVRLWYDLSFTFDHHLFYLVNGNLRCISTALMACVAISGQARRINLYKSYFYSALNCYFLWILCHCIDKSSDIEPVS